MGWRAALAALFALLCAAGVGGAGLEIGEMVHTSRDAGANEWWDAVTGRDEYGDLLTTFMHKRWGTAVQLYHESHNMFLPFRFIPNIGWISGNPKGRAQAMLFYGDGEMQTVDYWFASKHLEELNAAREADSLLPEEMDCGVWTGERVGSNMVFGNAGILHSNWDDSFTELRQLVLMEHGFIYLGMAGAAVTVLLDDRGVPEALPGVAGAMTDGCCFLAASADVRSKVLPTLLGVPAQEIQSAQLRLRDMVKRFTVSLRAANPVARMFSPGSYRKEKGRGWVWADKGSGNMLDGSNPYGDEPTPPAA